MKRKQSFWKGLFVIVAMLTVLASGRTQPTAVHLGLAGPVALASGADGLTHSDLNASSISRDAWADAAARSNRLLAGRFPADVFEGQGDYPFLTAAVFSNILGLHVQVNSG